MADSERLEFRPSTIHGIGAFARTDIIAGTRLIEYVGERITKSESRRRCALNNEFIFALDEEWDLDGSIAANLARFINHSCAPNCEAESTRGGVWITAKRDIKTGEEITFNYGFDLEAYRDYPCHCGAEECAGYIVAEDFFEHVLQHQWIGRPGDAGRG